jgi:predicted HicB family RNase H-like nuclease
MRKILQSIGITQEVHAALAELAVERETSVSRLVEKWIVRELTEAGKLPQKEGG